MRRTTIRQIDILAAASPAPMQPGQSQTMSLRLGMLCTVQPSSNERIPALPSVTDTSTPVRLAPIKPGLMVLHGNRLEDLRDLLTAWLARAPLRPLENELMLVQSNGIATRSEESRGGKECVSPCT